MSFYHSIINILKSSFFREILYLYADLVKPCERRESVLYLDKRKNSWRAVHMRIMAIDLGDARTGLAVSDAMGILCGEAWTMEEWDMERAAKRIAEAAKERGVERLVLGLPKNMDGSEGPRAEKSREFKAMLDAESGLPVVLWDERRSSIEAHAILHASGKKEKKHRKTVDAVAASLILEGYLGSI